MRSERLSSSVADVFMWAVWKYPLSLASITKTRLALIVLRRFEPGLNRPCMDCELGRLDVLAWAVWWNECAFSAWQDAQASSPTRVAAGRAWASSARRAGVPESAAQSATALRRADRAPGRRAARSVDKGIGLFCVAPVSLST